VRRSTFPSRRWTFVLVVAVGVAGALQSCGDGAAGTVESVSIAGATPRYVQAGETRTLTAVVEARGGATTGVVWRSSDEDVATVGADGTVVGVAPGEVLVMAVSAFDATKFAVAALEVTPAAIVTAATDGTYLTLAGLRLDAPDATGPGTRTIVLDLAWPESWRGLDRPTWVAAEDNWDAVWLFAKFRVADGPWRHATLAASGHEAPTGSVVLVPADGAGAFVHREAAGYGAFSADGVRLVWSYAGDGAVPGDALEVRVFGIEMVYVPEGSFYLGAGGSEPCGFRDGPTADPFLVAQPGPITLGDAPGTLSWATEGCSLAGSPEGVTDAAYPNGYGAFYLMKHELSQGLFAGFLNTLTQAQADVHRPTADLDAYRFGLTGGAVGSYASLRPHVAMPWIPWSVAAAFADWAGLRPMSELEFEKAARGPLPPTAEAFAWGTTAIVPATGLEQADAPSEVPLPADANANVALGLGPTRVGAFAAVGRTREDAGAGYYGALDLSGNILEVAVTVGVPEGRAFGGAHGDGALASSGHADVAGWPTTNVKGVGTRGGFFQGGAAEARTSFRSLAAFTSSAAHPWFGARFARSAP